MGTLICIIGGFLVGVNASSLPGPKFALVLLGLALAQLGMVIK